MPRPKPLLPALAAVLGLSAGGFGDPSALPEVSFVMKGGIIDRQ